MRLCHARFCSFFCVLYVRSNTWFLVTLQILQISQFQKSTRRNYILTDPKEKPSIYWTKSTTGLLGKAVVTVTTKKELENLEFESSAHEDKFSSTFKLKKVNCAEPKIQSFMATKTVQPETNQSSVGVYSNLHSSIANLLDTIPQFPTTSKKEKETVSDFENFTEFFTDQTDINGYSISNKEQRSNTGKMAEYSITTDHADQEQQARTVQPGNTKVILLQNYSAENKNDYFRKKTAK